MRAKALCLAIPALIVLAGCDFEDFGGMGRYHEDFHYSYPLKSGGRLILEGFNGAIEVSPWDQDTIDISGTKTAPSPSDLADVRIDVDHRSDTVEIRASRPMSRHGNFGARFAIKAPRGVIFERLRTSNGSIRIAEGTGPAS